MLNANGRDGIRVENKGVLVARDNQISCSANFGIFIQGGMAMQSATRFEDNALGDLMWTL